MAIDCDKSPVAKGPTIIAAVLLAILIGALTHAFYDHFSRSPNNYVGMHTEVSKEKYDTVLGYMRMTMDIIATRDTTDDHDLIGDAMSHRTQIKLCLEDGWISNVEFSNITYTNDRLYKDLRKAEIRDRALGKKN